MSKRVKSKEFVDSDSESSEEETEVKKTNKTTKAKKAKMSASSSKGDEDNFVFPLAPKRRVTVREFKSKIYVDIREFYEDSEGEMKPGKKGISLTVDQWQKFKGLVDDIDEAVGKLG